MTYAAKAITVTIQIRKSLADSGPSTPSIGGTGADTITLTNHRVLAQVSTVLNTSTVVGGTNIILRIYGMTLNEMNQLTVAGLQWQQLNNSVAVQAGDEGGQMTTVFNGQISSAFPDFTETPESAFVIVAHTGRAIAMKPVPPTSYPGPADAATIMKSMAAQCGLAFEPNGVSVQLASPYFAGTYMRQMATCARAANIYAHIDGSSNTLAIWPKTGSRGGDVPVISAADGMILYPMYQTRNVQVRTLFDPAVKYGGQVQIQSQLTPANGNWTVVGQLDYNLSSQMPDGPWEMTFQGVNSTKT
jgi:Baseplate hub gp41